MNPLYRNDPPGQYPPSWYAETAVLDAERPALTGAVRVDLAIVGAGLIFKGFTFYLNSSYLE